MGEEESFDLAAAGLRADAGDVATSIEVLGVKLEDALPGRATVRRRARRLFGKHKRVERIDVELGDSHYALRAGDGGAVEAWRERTVRGITIKREPLELAEWLEALSADLRARAGDSAEAQQALERLL